MSLHYMHGTMNWRTNVRQSILPFSMRFLVCLCVCVLFESFACSSFASMYSELETLLFCLSSYTHLHTPKFILSRFLNRRMYWEVSAVNAVCVHCTSETQFTVTALMRWTQWSERKNQFSRHDVCACVLYLTLRFTNAWPTKSKCNLVVTRRRHVEWKFIKDIARKIALFSVRLRYTMYVHVRTFRTFI